VTTDADRRATDPLDRPLPEDFDGLSMEVAYLIGLLAKGTAPDPAAAARRLADAYEALTELAERSVAVGGS